MALFVSLFTSVWRNSKNPMKHKKDCFIENKKNGEQGNWEQ